jgi:hypothetical protein
MISSHSDPPNYIVGIALGQNKDHAECIVQCQGNSKSLVCDVHQCISITDSYSAVIRKAKKYLVNGVNYSRTGLIVDATAVGRPVIEMFNYGNPVKETDILHFLRITAGDFESRTGNIWQVPKLDIVSTIRILQEDNRLVFIGTEDKELQAGLEQFDIKVEKRTGNSFPAWREGIESEAKVFALAIACWAAIHPQINTRS